MACVSLWSTCFGVLPDGCVSFPTRTHVGYENGVGCAYAKVLSGAHRGVLSSVASVGVDLSGGLPVRVTSLSRWDRNESSPEVVSAKSERIER